MTRTTAWRASLNGLAALVYVAFATELGFVADLEELFFESPDSRKYRGAMEWLFGMSDEGGVKKRPWGYPFLLGAYGLTGSVRAMWALQLALFLATANGLFELLRRRTGSLAIASVGFLAFATNLSLIALVHHGLAEISFLAVVMAWAAFLALTHERPRLHIPTVLGLAALATVTRPIFQPVLGLTLMYCAHYVWHQPRDQRRRLASLAALALAPVLLQGALARASDQTMGDLPSTRGLREFDKYFFSRLYERAEGLPSWREAYVLHEERFETREKLVYVTEHPALAANVFIENLWERNLRRASVFVDPLASDGRWKAYTLQWNRGMSWIHLLMPLIYAVGLATGRVPLQARDVLAWVALWALLVPAGLVFAQGDRLILGAYGLALATYGWSLHALVTGAGRDAQRAPPDQPSLG